MEECYLLDQEVVRQVEWQGDSKSYDLALRRLGPRGEPFLVQNPWVTDSRPFYFIDNIPDTDTCVVWHYKDEWQAKYFPVDWQPDHGYTNIEIEIPQFVWRKNPDFDRAMTFAEDIFGSFKPDSWQAQHELVWYIDPKFNPLEDKVWAISCKPIGKQTLGIMDMGYVSPDVIIEYNQDLPEFEINVDKIMPAYWDLAYECSYRLDPRHEIDQPIWVLKVLPAYRKPAGWRWYGVLSPSFHFTYNKSLPELDLEIDLDIPWHDLFFEQTWYLDRSYLEEGQEDIWVIKAKAIHDVQGEKNKGHISPSFYINRNPDVGDCLYNLDLDIKWYDLKYSHIWYLENRHTKVFEDKIWAVEVCFNKNPHGQKHYDLQLTPRIKINPILKNINFPELDLDIQYHDFQYTNVLYLDPYYANGEDIWAIQIDYTDSPEGYKKIGYIKPKVTTEYNPDLPNLKFKADYEIPYYDRNYLHVWYMKNRDAGLVWVAKSSISKKTKGEKVVAYVEPVFPDRLDVIFISYNEPNAEENWQRVREKAPWAKRVVNIKGIDRAHKAAAELSETDMFYVVDGDAWLVDDWNFDFQPSIFDRDCTYIWISKNPFNNLDYGYGGVKLLNRNLLLRTFEWNTLDFTTSINHRIKVMDRISNVSKFNVDAFSTWRSAFREGVKLCLNKDQYRLNNWVTIDADNVDMARLGIEEAIKFYKSNKKNAKNFLSINDRQWLMKYFNRLEKK